MVLHRLGNKRRIAEDIIKYFPVHDTYIEPFFGAGGMFFSKSKAKHNIVNDIDNDVFNLYQVISTRKDELIDAFKKMPVHQELMNYWRKHQETDEIRRALRFLLLSNYGYLGKDVTLRLGHDNTSHIILKNIDKTFELFFDVRFSNKDFRVFLKSISFRERSNIDKSFIYCDPPYLGTENNYSHSFTEQDSIDLFDCLQAIGCKFAISEFDNPFILEQANKRGLQVIKIAERQNIKNRRTEILIINYNTLITSLFNDN